MPPLQPTPPALGWTPLRRMVEAGGISEGGRATAGEDMEGTMADCGGRGTGGGTAAEAVAGAKNGGGGDLPPPSRSLPHLS